MSEAGDFVDRFRRYWAAPSLGGFDTALAEDVVLVQPLSPKMHGLAEVRAGFAPIFAWLPDLHGEVDRWSAEGNVVFIEFRLIATIGGRPFEWPVLDRFVLRDDGEATERVTYFDPLPLVLATVGRPSGWWRFLRSGASRALLGAGVSRGPDRSHAPLPSARSSA
jgi:hypothetical protein